MPTRNVPLTSPAQSLVVIDTRTNTVVGAPIAVVTTTLAPRPRRTGRVYAVLSDSWEKAIAFLEASLR